MATINERIKEQRTKLNLTLLEVAELLGVKEATVQRYESGEIKNIKHETVIALSEILKCTPAYLMGWENSENEKLSLNENEKDFLSEYRKLSENNKKTLHNHIKELQNPTKVGHRIAGSDGNVVDAKERAKECFELKKEASNLIYSGEFDMRQLKELIGIIRVLDKTRW